MKAIIASIMVCETDLVCNFVGFLGEENEDDKKKCFSSLFLEEKENQSLDEKKGKKVKIKTK